MRRPRGMLHTRMGASSVVALTLMAATVRSQAPGGPVAFEAVSVKESPAAQGAVPMRFGIPQPGGRWVATNSPLDYIIRSAYPGHDLREQLVGGPAWIAEARFDINAKAAGDPARDEITAMARAMLADRFKLRLHTDTREVAGYRLVPARSDRRLGPNLKPPATDCATFRAEQAKRPADVLVAGRGSPCTVMMLPVGNATRFVANGLELKGLATILSSVVGGPIVDATGVGGMFDILLEFASERSGDVSPAASDSPSVFTALQEQLGLRLESRRVPVELLVIDHVERPTPD